jgi:hypothetical protein
MLNLIKMYILEHESFPPKLVLRAAELKERLREV